MKGTGLDKAVFFGGIGLLVFSCSLHGTPSAIVGIAGIVLCCYKWQACFGTKAERKAKKEAQKVQAEMEAAQELPGAVYGAASAKSKTSVTFYVTYEDGHHGSETVNSDSSRFLKLMKVCKD